MRLSLFNSLNRFHFALLCLVVALPGRPAAAQPQREAQGNVYYLDLTSHAIAVPARTLYVEQVVDGRSGRPPIGMIYRGLYDKQAPVLFRKGLEEELTAWLRQQLPSQATPHAVVLCVRRLQVDEVVRGYSKGAFATAELVADVYEHQADGYHFVRNVAAHAGERGINANSAHAANVALVLQNCLTQLNDADWPLAARRPARTVGQLAADKAPAPVRPAILRVAVPRRGAYRTLEQFLTNRPDTTIAVRVDTVGTSALANAFKPSVPAGTTTTDWKGTALLKARMRTAAGERLPPGEVWGFSDGHQAYIRQINTYRPLVCQGDFFTFVGAAPVDVTAANRNARANAANVALGVPLSYSPDGVSGRPIVYALDLRTGQAAPFPGPGQPQRADTAFVYVYRPAGGAPEARRIMLNDREVGQLKPGEYLELAWPHTERPLRLSVDTPGGPAMLAAASTSAANYVRLVSGAASSPWQWMPVRQGAAEVDALEKRPRK